MRHPLSVSMNSVLVLDGLRIHTCPKNASTSIIRAAIFAPGNADCRTAPEEPGDEFRFMAVRHPCDRLLSAWMFFCQAAGGGAMLPRIERIGYRAGMALEEFLGVVLERPDGYEAMRPQIVFAGPHKLHLLVPIERLKEGWESLRDRFPILKPLDTIHKTPHGPWEDHISRRQLERIAAVFGGDIELYEAACRTSI